MGTRGDLVEVKKCFWNAAKVNRVNPDGTYEVGFTEEEHRGNFAYNELRIKVERYDPTDDVSAVNRDGKWEIGWVIQHNRDTDTYFVMFNGSGHARNEIPLSEICRKDLGADCHN